MRLAAGCLLAIAAGTASLGAQSPADSALAAYIAGIRAIDNHAHPLLPSISGAPRDTDYDALPLANIPPFPLPERLSLGDPIWIEAWRALYHYPFDDTAPPHVQLVLQAKQHLAADRGDQAAEWALDQMGTEVMLANRIAMGHGLGPPRFRWVAFDDPLLFPLSTTAEQALSPDVRQLYPNEERLLRRYLADLRLPTLPPTLGQYLATVVTPTLEAQRRKGAVAIKFEAAYLRSLDFGNPPRSAADSIYARYVRAGGGRAPSHAAYRTLEDFLFRYIAREAGRLGLAVHLHCNELAGGFYSVNGSNPLLLEGVFNDPTLRATRFVLLHGGWPFTRQTLAMLGKPNVYTDISLMTAVLSPYTLAAVLREWLTEYPDKVLFGTDAFADTNDSPVGWAEVGWVGSRTARRALAIALTGMLRDGDIRRDRAEDLARMVLRTNAMTLYGLPSP